MREVSFGSVMSYKKTDEMKAINVDNWYPSKLSKGKSHNGQQKSCGSCVHKNKPLINRALN